MQPHPALPAPFPAPDSGIPALEAPAAFAILIQGGDSRPGGEPPETQKAPSSPFGGFGWLPMVAIFAILWFVMIGPERKNKKLREALLANLKKGDEVMLSSGLYAKVASIQDDVVVLQIADGVRAKYSRASIQSVVTKAEASAPAAD
jgi:preprotein translocase subunit YajC